MSNLVSHFFYFYFLFPRSRSVSPGFPVLSQRKKCSSKIFHRKWRNASLVEFVKHSYLHFKERHKKIFLQHYKHRLCICDLWMPHLLKENFYLQAISHIHGNKIPFHCFFITYLQNMMQQLFFPTHYQYLSHVNHTTKSNQFIITSTTPSSLISILRIWGKSFKFWYIWL